MRIAVTGKQGQVVSALIEVGPKLGVEIFPVGRPELDLLSPETVQPAPTNIRPDIIVNAAAYTAVDQAEKEPEVAMAVNAGGAMAVADAARTLSVPLVHLSTDYALVYGLRGRADRGRMEHQAKARCFFVLYVTRAHLNSHVPFLGRSQFNVVRLNLARHWRSFLMTNPWLRMNLLVNFLDQQSLLTFPLSRSDAAGKAICSDVMRRSSIYETYSRSQISGSSKLPVAFSISRSFYLPKSKDGA